MSSSSSSPHQERPSRVGRLLGLTGVAAVLGVLVFKSGVACASTMPLRAGDTYLPDAGMAANNLPPPNKDPPRRVDLDAGPGGADEPDDDDG